LAHERGKIRVAADDREAVDVCVRVTKIQRVHHHANVRGVLAGLPHMRNLDQLERRLVQRSLEFLVPIEVTVGFLDDDIALQQQSLENLADIELGKARINGAPRNVLQIQKDGESEIRVARIQVVQEWGKPETGNRRSWLVQVEAVGNAGVRLRARELVRRSGAVAAEGGKCPK